MVDDTLLMRGSSLDAITRTYEVAVKDSSTSVKSATSILRDSNASEECFRLSFLKVLISFVMSSKRFIGPAVLVGWTAAFSPDVASSETLCFTISESFSGSSTLDFATSRNVFFSKMTVSRAPQLLERVFKLRVRSLTLGTRIRIMADQASEVVVSFWRLEKGKDPSDVLGTGCPHRCWCHKQSMDELLPRL